jgi:hypothetical protein
MSINLEALIDGEEISFEKECPPPSALSNTPAVVSFNLVAVQFGHSGMHMFTYIILLVLSSILLYRQSL